MDILLLLALFVVLDLIMVGLVLIAHRVVGETEPTHRVIRDLRPLEDALVDFFARSKSSSAVLSVLARNGKPVGFKALERDVRAEQERRRTHDEFSLQAVRAVLSILQVARFVRMSRDGFTITELGREAHRRMQSDAVPRLHSAATSGSTSGDVRRVNTSPTPHARRMRSDLRQEARTLVRQ
ncbi:MAG: hypothetical protein ABJF10_16105 [Chthoniobacter sp.]|uniref:hypothetical protein n=1 Tax=Chthoniobacter sp. TaxID=2510640 RepID=UPI0032A5218D